MRTYGRMDDVRPKESSGLVKLRNSNRDIKGSTWAGKESR